MALLEILEYPDTRLRTKATPVEVINDDIQSLITDMFETMYAAPGIGLAATQVNVHKRIVVVDISEDHSAPMVLINPQAEVLDGEYQSMQEGCLSVPGFYEKVSRIERCRVKALDQKGNALDFVAKGLLAICIQHEIDHLDGKLFIDYLSTLKRDRIRKKLEKNHHQKARD